MRTTRPPGLTSSSACATASGVPAVSTARSTPSRPEKRRAASASGPSTVACVVSAPSSPARAKRRRERTTTITRAPRPRSTCRARNPRVPAPTIAAFGFAPIHGADHDGERLGEQQRVAVGAGRGWSAAPRGDPDELGEAAVHIDADRDPREAQIAVALAAEWAPAARVVRLDDDGIARAHLGHPRRDALDTADELVSHHAGIGDRSATAPDLVVGAAEAGRDDPHDDLPGLGRRIARVLDAKIAWPVENRRFHGANLLDGRGRGN